MRAKSAKRGPRRPFSQGPRIRTRLASSRRFRARKARGRNFERFPDLRRISSTRRPDAASTPAVDSPRTSARASDPNSSRSMRATAPVATSRRKSSPGASHDGRRRRLGRPRSPETLPLEGGIAGRPPRAREASPRRRRDRLLDQAERDPRDRRRVGLREDDHGPPPRETRRAHGRPTPVPRQRQRVAIARAIVLQPEFIVADEPVSMLDVSIRAGVMNLLLQLRDEFRLTLVFISHDVGVTRYMSDRIAVMYLGRIVELGTGEEVIAQPLHPYTQALLTSVPVTDPKFQRGRAKIQGELPSPIDLPSGCTFHPRCP